ncbi:hypothetical protein wTpre_935 [Wolbachia endosymbiont of Trichogramma pretiosum]|nr:hypothetical protein wTpre_935 [Wolbachia endosymbiont of Trichogramma pretiosum]
MHFVNMFGSKPKSKFMLFIGKEGTVLLYFKNVTTNFIKNL